MYSQKNIGVGEHESYSVDILNRLFLGSSLFISNHSSPMLCMLLLVDRVLDAVIVAVLQYYSGMYTL